MSSASKNALRVNKPIFLVVLLLALVFFSLTLVRARDLLAGDISRRENNNINYKMLVGSLPAEFDELLGYLREAEPLSKNILWLPLNYANYLILPDSTTPEGVFLGTSFVREATGQRDYPGLYNLGPNHELIKKNLLMGDYQLLCRSIWENGINLLVSNNYFIDTRFRRRFEEFFSTSRSFDLYEAQTSDHFISSVRGARLASFGPGFDLYKVKSNLISDRLELYERNVTTLAPGDWCVLANSALLPSEYSFSRKDKSYSVTANLYNVQEISVVLSERFGYRYLLSVSSPAAEKINSIDYIRAGSKWVAKISFKGNISGKFKARFETRSLFERYPSIILSLQGLMIFFIGILLMWLYWRKSFQTSQKK